MIRQDNELYIGAGVPTEQEFHDSSLVIRGGEHLARVVFSKQPEGTTAWARSIGSTGEEETRGVSAIRGNEVAALGGIIADFQRPKDIRPRSTGLSIFRQKQS
jgi:hypothetical protein